MIQRSRFFAKELVKKSGYPPILMKFFCIFFESTRGQLEGSWSKGRDKKKAKNFAKAAG